MNLAGDVVNCRIVLIGDTMVGKISLLNRFMHNKFDRALPQTVSAFHKCEQRNEP